jgi:hypothetical protein
MAKSNKKKLNEVNNHIIAVSMFSKREIWLGK